MYLASLFPNHDTGKKNTFYYFTIRAWCKEPVLDKDRCLVCNYVLKGILA